MSDQRSCVLLVTRNFPPLRGGMERLNQRMLQGLAMRAPVGLVGPSGCSALAPNNSGVREVPASPLWRFLLGALLAVVRQAIARRPRIVLAGSGLVAPLAWFAARITGARCAVYLHGLDLIVPNAIYQRLWLPLIRRCDIAITNSHNTMRLAVERGVDAGRIHVVHPGTDLPEADPDARRRFRDEHGFGEHPLLLSVGRLTKRKGLAEFVRYALPAILAGNPETLLLVIGADASDALTGNAGSERARIIEVAREANVESALCMLPHCDDATLSMAYSASDVHVFPVLDTPGDVEGFGMVAIEAAAHGLPTVGFGAGGVGDAVVAGVTGETVPNGDYEAFARSVLVWLKRIGNPSVRVDCRAGARRFSWEIFNKRLWRAITAEM